MQGNFARRWNMRWNLRRTYLRSRLFGSDVFQDRGSGANAGRHGSALKYRIAAACRGARLWGSCALWHVRRVLKP